ncbi:tetratricopeptide repeat protein [Clostridium sp. C2-6-12]|uniref:tetratricopeptide repeat protein n=1 Tax=Clostridium sp. C2-6-12 TaxID=2698832 RepID=UPI00136887A5|nr:tetratricopeptide repeat protein [Clostridium sp. C2-6-12]
MIDLNSVKLKSFEKLPQDWVCLYCESSKEHFGDQIVQTMYAPNQAEVYIRRGKLYMEKGEIAFAKQDFQTAVKIDGTRLNEVKAYI